MKKILIYCSVFLAFNSCIEPYEFVVEDESPGFVIDGYITNTSYLQSLSYPSDGELMQVKISYTSDVDNVENSEISGAKVWLQDKAGNQWNYSSEGNTGNYYLSDPDFKALQGVDYQIVVVLPQGDTIKSTWERLPHNIDLPMGDIRFEEITKNVYQFIQGERTIVNQKGVDVMIELPENDSDQPVHYHWEFQPTWIYIAPLASSTSIYRKCWASNQVFLSDYQLHQDLNGGYKNRLFYLPTEYNERIFHKLSVLVVQQILSEDYYNYWSEIKAQADRGGLFAEPPYNLKTNLSSSNPDVRVNGYFAVVAEQAKRWYFDTSMLSYNVPNTQLESCQEMPFPSLKCNNCEAYQGGEATNVKPSWWSDEE